MISTLRQYGALVGAFFLLVLAGLIYYFGRKHGSEKWKTIAKNQQAKAEAIFQEHENAKEAKKEAKEYKAEQTKKADEDIEDDGYTSTIDTGINDYD